jgi:hypothetical protein
MLLADMIHSPFTSSNLAPLLNENSGEVRHDGQEKKLHRKQLIEDIFNSLDENDEDKHKRKGGRERLSLSHTSRILSEEFLKRVQQFLSAHRDLERALEWIWLPDDEYLEPKMRRQIHWMTRRFNRYWHWMALQRAENAQEEPQGSAYLKVHALGKDELIIEFYQEYYLFYSRTLKEFEGIVTHCSYYYRHHPPAYRFN